MRTVLISDIESRTVNTFGLTCLFRPSSAYIVYMCMSVLPHIPAFLLAVAQEGPILTGVDVCVYGDDEALVELKGTWELLRQLPHTLQELIDNWRHLFRISIKVGIPAGKQPHLNCLSLSSKNHLYRFFW